MKSALSLAGLGPKALLARRKFDTRDYPAALELVTELLQKHPDNAALLHLTAEINTRTGELSQALVAYDSLVRVDSSARWKVAKRSVEGRLRETDPSWLPVVPFPQQGESGTSILYLAKESRPFLSNGFCTRTHETLVSLGAAGVDITCVTMPGFPAVIEAQNPPHESSVEGVTYRHLLPRAGRLAKDLPYDDYLQLATQLLARETQRLSVGLIHVGSGHRGYETALVGSAVARWAGIPWVYEVRSFFENTWSADRRYNESSEYYHRRLLSERRMMHAADAVVTISGPMRDEIVNVHGIDPAKVRVIPNAVDVEKFNPEPKSAELVRELDLGDNFVVGYISNLSHPREGQEVLIRAIAESRRRGHKVVGLLVGDGSRRSELEELARAEGVSDRVRFVGSVPFDKIASYYALIDLFVVPRVDERAARLVSPIKPFEAMAMRIPLLTSDLPALAEIIGNGERGQTFRAGDHIDLATKVNELRHDVARRVSMTQAAYTWVRTERSWGSTASAFSGLYDSLVSGKAATS